MSSLVGPCYAKCASHLSEGRRDAPTVARECGSRGGNTKTTPILHHHFRPWPKEAFCLLLPNSRVLSAELQVLLGSKSRWAATALTHRTSIRPFLVIIWIILSSFNIFPLGLCKLRLDLFWCRRTCLRMCSYVLQVLLAMLSFLPEPAPRTLPTSSFLSILALCEL